MAEEKSPGSEAREGLACRRQGPPAQGGKADRSQRKPHLGRGERQHPGLEKVHRPSDSSSERSLGSGPLRNRATNTMAITQTPQIAAATLRANTASMSGALPGFDNDVGGAFRPYKLWPVDVPVVWAQVPALDHTIGFTLQKGAAIDGGFTLERRPNAQQGGVDLRPLGEGGLGTWRFEVVSELHKARIVSASLMPVNSIARLECVSVLLNTQCMHTIDEIRRTNLLALIAEYKTQAALARETGINPGQISQWVNKSADSKTGKPRVMDSSSARKIEAAIKKPDGWMDTLHPIASNFRTPSPNPAISSTDESPLNQGSTSASVKNFTSGFRQTTFNPANRAPIVLWGQLGEDVIVEDENDRRDELVAPVSFGEGAVVWRIEDDSMSPDYNPGDFIAIDTAPVALKALAAGEAVIVETSGGTKILRYYTPLADGHFEARPPAGSRYGALSTLQMPLQVKAVVQAHLRIRRQGRMAA